MSKYSGTQTEKNLEAAFAGESQARNKYTYFASRAKKDGFEQIAAIFEETANNEKEHAKLWFKELEGIGDTAQNLAAAADGENYATPFNRIFKASLPLYICTQKRSRTTSREGLRQFQRARKNQKMLNN